MKTRAGLLAAAGAAVAATALAVGAPAQEASSPDDAAPAAPIPARPETDPNDPWIWGDVAVLRGLDKVTAATRDFEAPVGQTSQFFALTIEVKRCAKRPPEMQPEVIVGMEVFDRQTDGSGAEIEPERIFSGWMFGSSPALNPLEHPVYDVWVLDCVRTAEAPEPDAAPSAGD